MNNFLKKWDITCERYVGFIDIMGFKDMMLKIPHDDIYNMMIKIHEVRNFNEKIVWSKNSSGLVTTSNYSDSIMVYSKDGSINSFESFSTTISSLIQDLFSEDIPFKGAIAYGKMTLDFNKSIFFGQPLIDSYLLQDELLFYGIIIHATAEKEMLKFDDKIESLFISNYLCPLKNGSCYHYTIYPINADAVVQGKDQEEYEELLSYVNKFKYRTSGYLRRYIDNTKNYLEHINKKTKI